LCSSQMAVFMETGARLQRGKKRSTGVPSARASVLRSPSAETRLHVKIYDPNNARWEVPQTLLPRTPPSTKPATMDYLFSYTSNPFGFAVQRSAQPVDQFDQASALLSLSAPLRAASDSDVLFNTTTNLANPVFNGLIFENQVGSKDQAALSNLFFFFCFFFD